MIWWVCGISLGVAPVCSTVSRLIGTPPELQNVPIMQIFRLTEVICIEIYRKCSQNSMPINRKSPLNESRLSGFYVIFINGKDFFIVVLKKTIWKITIFLDFCRKMRKVSLRTINKHYIRYKTCHRGIGTKHTTFLFLYHVFLGIKCIISMLKEEKKLENNDEELYTPSP